MGHDLTALLTMKLDLMEKYWSDYNKIPGK
jgi:hypothetical protein